MTSPYDQRVKSMLCGGGAFESDGDGFEMEPPTATELTPVEFEPVDANDVNALTRDQMSDFQFNRSNLRGNITRLNAALEYAMKLATISDSPEVLKAIVSISTASVDASRKLSDLNVHTSNMLNKMPEEQKQSVQNNIQTNNYYQMSAEEKEIKEKDDILAQLDARSNGKIRQEDDSDSREHQEGPGTKTAEETPKVSKGKTKKTRSRKKVDE